MDVFLMMMTMVRMVNDMRREMKSTTKQVEEAKSIAEQATTTKPRPPNTRPAAAQLCD